MEKVKGLFSRRTYYGHLLEGLVFFMVSVYVTHLASRYATLQASNPVEDIILSNTSAHNFEFLFVQLAIGLCLLVVAIMVRFPKSAPFTLKTIGLFIMIRSVFVSLTHIGPYPTKLVLDSKMLDFITTGNDLFFSGHTGLPFLIALIYWKHKHIRSIFLFASLLFGVVVLLSHLHYSIDVFAAFFITYSIYHISMFVFRRDYSYFMLQDKVK